MREIIIDTETTGLDPLSGHRVVEIGAVELVEHAPTGRTFHCYLNPERAVPADAVAVHGLTAEFLADKPPFDYVADEFLAFVGDAPLVAHNAGFDIAFLNAELTRVAKGTYQIFNKVRFARLEPIVSLFQALRRVSRERWAE
jgi:DNA polymerase III subunit epsilon